MNCLLCERPGAVLSAVDADTWSLACEACGTFRFDRAFGEMVKQARARHQLETVRILRHLADVIRDADTRIILRPSTYTRLLADD